MIKYATGTRRQITAKYFWGKFFLKSAWGALSGYKVFRPPPDHRVYEADNFRLSSTTLKRAKIIHRISCWEQPSRPAVIEFEHPYMLIGSVGEGHDYVAFRAALSDRFAEMGDWLDSKRYRLVATSNGARARAIALLKGHRSDVDHDVLFRILPWSGEIRRHALPRMTDGLHVFHYGGIYPASKGTLDVLEVAKLLPRVVFHISAALDHPLLSGRWPPNTRLYPLHDRAGYYRGLRRSHVVLHPIYGDGWGVVIDALTHAMPLVIYDSYDKAEAIEKDVSGRLVALPKALSFYDGFEAGTYRNAAEFEELIAASADRTRIESIAGHIEAYARNEELLRVHSAASVRRCAERHDPETRASQIRELYRELLANT